MAMAPINILLWSEKPFYPGSYCLIVLNPNVAVFGLARELGHLPRIRCLGSKAYKVRAHKLIVYLYLSENIPL